MARKKSSQGRKSKKKRSNGCGGNATVASAEANSAQGRNSGKNAGPGANAGPVPDLFWGAISMDELRMTHRFVALPEAELLLPLPSPAAARYLRQDSPSWRQLHPGVLTTGLLKEALGLREPLAARVVGGRKESSHSPLLAAFRHLQLPTQLPPPQGPREAPSDVEQGGFEEGEEAEEARWRRATMEGLMELLRRKWERQWGLQWPGSHKGPGLRQEREQQHKDKQQQQQQQQAGLGAQAVGLTVQQQGCMGEEGSGAAVGGSAAAVAAADNGSSSGNRGNESGGRGGGGGGRPAAVAAAAAAAADMAAQGRGVAGGGASGQPEAGASPALQPQVAAAVAPGAAGEQARGETEWPTTHEERYRRCSAVLQGGGLAGVRCAWGKAQEAAALSQLLNIFPASTLHEVGMCWVGPALTAPWPLLPPLAASPDAVIAHHLTLDPRGSGALQRALTLQQQQQVQQQQERQQQQLQQQQQQQEHDLLRQQLRQLLALVPMATPAAEEAEEEGSDNDDVKVGVDGGGSDGGEVMSDDDSGMSSNGGQGDGVICDDGSSGSGCDSDVEEEGDGGGDGGGGGGAEAMCLADDAYDSVDGDGLDGDDVAAALTAAKDATPYSGDGTAHGVDRVKGDRCVRKPVYPAAATAATTTTAAGAATAAAAVTAVAAAAAVAGTAAAAAAATLAAGTAVTGQGAVAPLTAITTAGDHGTAAAATNTTATCCTALYGDFEGPARGNDPLAALLARVYGPAAPTLTAAAAAAVSAARTTSGAAPDLSALEGVSEPGGGNPKSSAGPLPRWSPHGELLAAVLDSELPVVLLCSRCGGGRPPTAQAQPQPREAEHVRGGASQQQRQQRRRCVMSGNEQAPMPLVWCCCGAAGAMDTVASEGGDVGEGPGGGGGGGEGSFASAAAAAAPVVVAAVATTAAAAAAVPAPAPAPAAAANGGVAGGYGGQHTHVVLREVVEVKNTCPFGIRQVRRGGKGRLFSEVVLSDRGPRHAVSPLWVPQLQLHMMAAGCQSGLLVSRSATKGTTVFRMLRNDGYLGLMMALLARFNAEYVLRGRPPPTDMFNRLPDYAAFLAATARLARSAVPLLPPGATWMPTPGPRGALDRDQAFIRRLREGE